MPSSSQGPVQPLPANLRRRFIGVSADGGYFTDAKLHFSIETDGTWRFSAQWLRARRADFLSLALRRKRSRRAACRQPAARGPARNDLRGGCESPPLSSSSAPGAWFLACLERMASASSGIVAYIKRL